jgi:dihydroflavonol-4-reductase
MGRAFVTGSTGFLGSHLTSELVRMGHSPVGLSRNPDPQAPGENLVGDVLDPGPWERHLEGADVLFHCAGIVDRSREARRRLFEVHVEGTARTLEAAARHGVRRVVMVSTSGTVAISDEAHPEIDESWPYPTELVSRWPYYGAKIEAERVALSLASELGISLTLVNPSLLLGPGDVRQSSTGDVADLMAGKVPMYPSGGLSFVDARDVALATAAAWEQGRPGERYLLGAANWTLREFALRVAHIAGVNPPRWPAPDGATRWLARISAAAAEKVGVKPPLDPVSVEMSQVFWWFSSEKARRELGFRPRDVDVTLRDTVEWLRGAR